MPEYIANIILSLYEEWTKNAHNNSDQYEVAYFEKSTILSVLDNKWQIQINRMDKLRSNVNLVQYSQKNPYQVYTQEGTKLFESMLDDIAYDVLIKVFKDRRGKKSLITKEMRNDPIFEQIQINWVLDPHLSIEEQEKQLIEHYLAVKRRLQEIQEETELEQKAI
nr:hypothetical protein [Mycoplasmopsis cynos]